MTRDLRLRVNGYPVQCHEYELTAVYVRLKRLQIVPIYRDYIGVHCQTAPCILNIVRDGAQPYKQHMLKNELTASRTRATKVRIIDMPI